jgi:hypothetical protein
VGLIFQRNLNEKNIAIPIYKFIDASDRQRSYPPRSRSAAPNCGETPGMLSLAELPEIFVRSTSDFPANMSKNLRSEIAGRAK